MGVVQSTFNTRPAVAYNGMRANTEPENVISRTVESAAGIAFGQPAFRGSDDHGCIVGATFAATGAGSAAAGNTGAETITAAPAVAAGAKAGRYVLTAVTAGATAIFLMTDPDGIPLGEATTGTPATLGGIGPFTITDAGVDPAIGDQMYIDVTFTANAKMLGIVVPDPSVPALAASPDQIVQYGTASIMDQGVVWVTAGEAVNDGDPAYWNPATGRFTKTVSHIPVPFGIYDTTAAANGDLVRLAIRKRLS